MNSGITSQLTRGRMLSSRGTHQKFDRTAYGLIASRIKPDAKIHWPLRGQILRFEGYGGPDGLKLKGNYNTDHLWDPINEIGRVPDFIASHYQSLVAALKVDDMVEAGFHAGWLGHYLCDSLTPAHHMSHKLVAEEYKDKSKMRKRWLYWGRKGLMSTHVAYEAGVSWSVFFSPLRVKFDESLYKRIRREGVVVVVKEESRAVAEHHIYRDFMSQGWTRSLAKQTRTVVINRIPQLIAAVWLSAYQEAQK